MQQITKVNLKAIKRCDQIWNDMKPIPGGRQCGLCKKKITDFREKSLKEIAEIHVYSGEPVCGIYTEHQLRNEENPIPIESISWWNSIKRSYLSFASFLLTLSVSAQDSTAIRKPKIEQGISSSINSDNNLKFTGDLYLLKGFISKGKNERLEYANIILLKNNKVISGATTDKNGYFELDVTLGLDKFNDNYKFEISYIGLSKNRIIIGKTKFIQSEEYNNLYIHHLNHQFIPPGTVVTKAEIKATSFGVISKPRSQKVINNKKQSWVSTLWMSIKLVFSKKTNS